MKSKSSQQYNCGCNSVIYITITFSNAKHNIYDVVMICLQSLSISVIFYKFIICENKVKKKIIQIAPQ